MSRVRETPPARSPSTTRYVESSAVVAALMEGDVAALEALRVPGEYVTSALTIVECRRAVVRARSAGRISLSQERDALLSIDVFARRCAIVAIADTIVERAGRPFPLEPIRTLDSIHLATLDLLDSPRPDVTIVSRDVRVRDNARALGFIVE